MTIQGFRTSENFVTDGRPKDWRASVLIHYPNGDAPLFGFTNAMKSETVSDPEFNWWEKSMQSRRFALGADLDNTGGTENTTIVSGGLSLKEGDILLVEHTGELLFITANPSSDTTISTQRAFGSVAATAVDFDGAAVNPNLMLIGSAYEEGSAAPDGRAYDPTKKYNVTQIFRNTFEHTRTAMKTKLRTGDDVAEAKRETLELHMRDIEWAFFLGEKKETTKNSKPLRTTAGLKSFIPSGNKLAASSGQLDMETLEGWMELFFAKGSSEKLAFVGNRAMTCIQQVVRKNTSYQIYANEKVFGTKVTRLTGPHGDLVLKRHPMFNQYPGATGAQTYYGMDSTMVVIDQKELVYRYMPGDDTRYEQKLQDNGIDGEKSGFLTDCGLEVHFPESHFWVSALNKGIADT